MTTSTEEARAFLVEARVDLAKAMIKNEWGHIVVATHIERDFNEAPDLDFRMHCIDQITLIGIAEQYYGNRMEEIEPMDNVAAFIQMVKEVVGDELAKYGLEPTMRRSHQTGEIRLFFLPAA